MKQVYRPQGPFLWLTLLWHWVAVHRDRLAVLVSTWGLGSRCDKPTFHLLRAMKPLRGFKSRMLAGNSVITG